MTSLLLRELGHSRLLGCGRDVHGAERQREEY